MAIENPPKMQYRKDYQPTNYLIDTIDLTITLSEEEAQVISKMFLRKNPLCKEKENSLALNGENQFLESVKINGEVILGDEYELTDQYLILKDLPEEFTLEIESMNRPQENRELTGLYKTQGWFCTQCESEGFRRITYFLDRPDVLSKFTTTIIADQKKYPVLLSNGNLIDSGELSDGLHWMKWEDPFKKPCYLFAMVAGDLDFIEDNFIACSGRDITLRIFAEKGQLDKCQFAMSSLKKAMKWDEEAYGREYDLNNFMIVAANDFNYGAMENKGLNIFNDKYIFAKPETATDTDYSNIDEVVAHEYFHNWTGNRVTCRDWFQICLKEGFTVFRDQTFSEEIGSRAVHRINQVKILRTLQFPEDASPLAHPIYPDRFIEINNMYTATVYQKGPEVIRMLQTLLGKEGFRKGSDLYFEKFDGQAVTCDDFIAVMAEANHIDLTQFKLWYNQSGTPELTVHDDYDEKNKTYILKVKQFIPPTPNQPVKSPMVIPLAIGLLNSHGEEILFEGGESTKVLVVDQPEQCFEFKQINERPVPSLLRHFSAPVKLRFNYRNEQLAFLMVNDSDAFARWEAGQQYAVNEILQLIHRYQQEKPLTLSEDFVYAYKKGLQDAAYDKALVALMLELPAEIYLAELMETVDVDGIHYVREFVKNNLAKLLKDDFLQVYLANQLNKPYEYNMEDAAKRSLKNICLSYLMALDDPAMCELGYQQYQKADNMTNQFAALVAFANTNCSQREIVLSDFYHQWKENLLVIDKWLAVQASSILPDTYDRVMKLLDHPSFNIQNPNRVYSLLRTFERNQAQFHDVSGRGYQLLADLILKIDQFNMHLASRLMEPFSKWRRFDPVRQELMKEQLIRISKAEKLSKGVYELVTKSLD